MAEISDSNSNITKKYSSALDEEAEEFRELLSSINDPEVDNSLFNKGLDLGAGNKTPPSPVSRDIQKPQPEGYKRKKQADAVFYESTTETEYSSNRTFIIRICLTLFVVVAMIIGILIYDSVVVRPTIVEQQVISNIDANGQKYAEASDEITNLVRNNVSYLAGSNIYQALTAKLNESGVEWHPLGWQIKPNSEKSDLYDVQFVWQQQGIKKVALWQVDYKIKKIRAINEIATQVSPPDSPKPLQ